MNVDYAKFQKKCDRRTISKEADNNDRLKVMIINLRNTNMIKTIDGIFHKHSMKKDLKCKYFD